MKPGSIYALLFSFGPLLVHLKYLRLALFWHKQTDDAQLQRLSNQSDRGAYTGSSYIKKGARVFFFKPTFVLSNLDQWRSFSSELLLLLGTWKTIIIAECRTFWVAEENKSTFLLFLLLTVQAQPEKKSSVLIFCLILRHKTLLKEILPFAEEILGLFKGISL